MNDILEGYAAAATPELIDRYEAFDPANLYASVLDLFPTRKARVADIGAGTGRDAAWFARRGHDAVAVEPVRQLREAGMALHRDDGILWIEDALPHLSKLAAHGPFDLMTLCGVWQHIDDEEREIAMIRMAQLAADGCLLVMSLRHGPGAPGRRVYPVSTDETIGAAARSGFFLRRRAEINSIQPGNRAMGVRWTWLAFEKQSCVQTGTAA